MLLCRNLSALCMQCLRADYASIAMAFLFPTFGKRPKEQEKDGCGKRAAVTSSATERTPREPAAEPVDATSLGSSGNAVTERVPPNALDQQADVAEPTSVATAADEHSLRASLDDVLVRLQSSNHANVLRIRAAAETLQRGSQQDIRNLCTPWGVSQREKKSTGKYGNRPDFAIKKDLMIPARGPQTMINYYL